MPRHKKNRKQSYTNGICTCNSGKKDCEVHYLIAKLDDREKRKKFAKAMKG